MIFTNKMRENDGKSCFLWKTGLMLNLVIFSQQQIDEEMEAKACKKKPRNR